MTMKFVERGLAQSVGEKNLIILSYILTHQEVVLTSMSVSINWHEDYL